MIVELIRTLQGQKAPKWEALYDACDNHLYNIRSKNSLTEVNWRDIPKLAREDRKFILHRYYMKHRNKGKTPSKRKPRYTVVMFNYEEWEELGKPSDMYPLWDIGPHNLVGNVRLRGRRKLKLLKNVKLSRGVEGINEFYLADTVKDFGVPLAL